jgi:hypothetical protein
MEKCDIDLLLVDDSTKHALGRIDNIIIELHMTFSMLILFLWT